MFRTILFDLDGTLVNSQEGITKSIQYAMKELGKPIPSADQLLPCIGPPLIDSFQNILGLEYGLAVQAVDLYRQRYSKIGKFELSPYEGIKQLLMTLKERGYVLFVATSKPQPVATEIISQTGLSPFFNKVYGAYLDGRFNHKPELLQHLLEEEKLKKEHTLMVGDRKFDLLGAAANQIASLGVTYGFGSLSELQEHQPTYLAGSPNASHGNASGLFYHDGLFIRLWA